MQPCLTLSPAFKLLSLDFLLHSASYLIPVLIKSCNQVNPSSCLHPIHPQMETLLNPNTRSILRGIRVQCGWYHPNLSRCQSSHPQQGLIITSPACRSLFFQSSLKKEQSACPVRSAGRWRACPWTSVRSATSQRSEIHRQQALGIQNNFCLLSFLKYFKYIYF